MKRAARGILRWLTIAVVSAALLAQTAACWWPGELACHWSLHAAVLAIPGAIAFRRSLLGILAGLAIPLGAWPWVVAAHAQGAPEPKAGASRLVVAQANLCYRNRHPLIALGGLAHREVPLDLLTLIGDTAGDRLPTPDILCLVEATRSDEAAIRALPTWPHQAWDWIEENSGVALLSRRPIARWIACDVEGGPILQAWIVVDGGEWRIIAAHPFSPLRPGRTLSRDAQLAAIAHLAREGSQPVLVLADGNCTVASPVWRAFAAESGLRRAAGGEPATWPDWLGPMGIGIDHILVGPGLAVGAERPLRLVGSDHRGLVAEVAAAP